MNPIRKVQPIAVATSLILAGAAPVVAQAETSGNISIVSKYVLRGITSAAENSGAALQGGFDWADDSGFYAGYWGSSLGYPSADGPELLDTTFENDFYGGYAGEIEGFSYDLGATYYYYLDTSDANGFELTAYVGFGPVTAGFKYLAQDLLWGNQGDMYWTVDYETDLPKDFGFAASLGYYTYEDSGKFIPSTVEDSAFRHLNLSLSHPIGDTGADMSVTYIIGGKDRNGIDQEDAIVFGVGWGFDI